MSGERRKYKRKAMWLERKRLDGVDARVIPSEVRNLSGSVANPREIPHSASLRPE
jgi:hypothetical protein